jgi:hypothetical protein
MSELENRLMPEAEKMKLTVGIVSQSTAIGARSSLAPTTVGMNG